MATDFSLVMLTDNDAFAVDVNAEIARILRDIADGIENGRTVGTARDVNGNAVGTYGVRNWTD